MTPPVWPAPPTVGHPIEVPLHAPATLLAALGYRGDAQYVALYQRGPIGVMVDGLAVTGTHPYGWRLFRGHRLVEQLLHGYQLGSNHELARHRMVVDQLTSRLTIALPDDADALLASQPTTREALITGLSAADVARYNAIAVEAARDPADRPDRSLQDAHALRIAQRTMVDDLDAELGRRLGAQIRGLADTVRDATRRPNPNLPHRTTHWLDLDHKPPPDGPVDPGPEQPPVPDPDLG